MYEKVKKIYYDKELYIIGALDCFGVPHTPDNVESKSYIDMVSEELTLNGIYVNYVNMHSIGCNKTWSLKKIIDSDYQKQEYYNLNYLQSKKAVNTKNVFPFPMSPNFLERYYSNTDNPNLKVTSHYTDAINPIFFYSCGQMNMHHYMKMGTHDISKVIPQILFHFNQNFKKTICDVKEMIDYLISLNPTVKIYVFGVYPMFQSYAIRKILLPIYRYANIEVKKLCDSYSNVFFVDVIDNINFVAKDDCHPNYLGQCNMKKKVLKMLNY